MVSDKRQEISIEENTMNSSVVTKERPRTQQRDHNIPNKKVSNISTAEDTTEFRQSITHLDMTKYSRSKTPLPNNYMI
jgi:hypothetical protein